MMTVAEQAQKLIQQHIGRKGCDSLASELGKAGLLRADGPAALVTTNTRSRQETTADALRKIAVATQVEHTGVELDAHETMAVRELIEGLYAIQNVGC